MPTVRWDEWPSDGSLDDVAAPHRPSVETREPEPSAPPEQRTGCTIDPEREPDRSRTH